MVIIYFFCNFIQVELCKYLKVSSLCFFNLVWTSFNCDYLMSTIKAFHLI